MEKGFCLGFCLGAFLGFLFGIVLIIEIIATPLGGLSEPTSYFKFVGESPNARARQTHARAHGPEGNVL